MSITKKTSTLAIRDLFNPSVCAAAAHVVLSQGTRFAGEVAADMVGKLGGDVVKQRVQNIRDHFTDQSQDLLIAIRQSNEQAWKTLEIALAGPSLWEGTLLDRLKTSATDRRLIDDFRKFLDSTIGAQDPDYGKTCLRELRHARQAGLFDTVSGFRLEEVIDDNNPFAWFIDTGAQLQAERELLASAGRDLRDAGYPTLASLLEWQPAGAQEHLLAIAARHHFESAVSSKPKLKHKIHFAKLDQINARVQKGFAFLAELQLSHAGEFDHALKEIVDIRQLVDANQRGIEALADHVRSLEERIVALLTQKELPTTEYTYKYSFTFSSPAEKELIRQILAEYRRLSPEQRATNPHIGLLMTLASLAGGLHKEAFQAAVMAAESQSDDAARAKIEYAAFKSAIETRNFAAALEQLKLAAKHDSRFRLWPFDAFEPVRILGAGGFGVAFLCEHRHIAGERHVLKAFDYTAIDSLGSHDSATPKAKFAEARTIIGLWEAASRITGNGSPSAVAHEGLDQIIRLKSCGFVYEDRQQNAYLTLEHIDGCVTLQEYVDDHGKFTPEAFRPIAVAIARGLRYAHAHGVLHRDIKPANVLVRRNPDGWTVKLIDFGLAAHRKTQLTTQAMARTNGGIYTGASSGGTFEYAAPEQLDPNRFHEVGHPTDVFGFGKLTYFALFATPNPDDDDKDALEKRWKRILRKATKAKPAERYPNFDDVLKDLQPEPAPTPPPPKPQSESAKTDQSVLVFSIVSIVLLVLGIWFISLWRGNAGNRGSSQPPGSVKQEFVKSGGSDNRQVSEPQTDTRVSQVVPWQGQTAGDRKIVKLGDLEIPLRWCPPGNFTMGSPKNEEGRYDDEDQLQVRLTKGFWMMETEVTQAMWEAVMGGKLEWEEKYGLGPNYPAYFVDWAMANDFAAKLTQKLVASGQLPTGMKLALPTEAQWEYACRAGTTTRFPFGDDPTKLMDHAWFGDNSGSSVLDAQKIWDADPKVDNYSKKIFENGCKSHPVAAKIANSWGLHDMLGNVLEWCADSYAEKLPGGLDPLVSAEPGYRVDRGGSWHVQVRNCRSAYRNWNAPGYRFENLGFRLTAVL